VWRAGFDDGMQPLAQNAIRFRHLGDLRKHGTFPSALSARGPRRAAAFISWARSLIAPRSSSVNPSNFLSPAVVLFAGFRMSFIAGPLRIEVAAGV
jgi:hypothetical protein